MFLKIHKTFNCQLDVMSPLIFCVQWVALQCVILAFSGHTHLCLVTIWMDALCAKPEI